MSAVLSKTAAKFVDMYSRSTRVKRKCFWASKIEWPVVKHSRDKKINEVYFERVILRNGAGGWGAEWSSSRHGMSMSK
jgi:hypothetical protein